MQKIVQYRLIEKIALSSKLRRRAAREAKRHIRRIYKDNSNVAPPGELKERLINIRGNQALSFKGKTPNIGSGESIGDLRRVLRKRQFPSGGFSKDKNFHNLVQSGKKNSVILQDIGGEVFI